MALQLLKYNLIYLFYSHPFLVAFISNFVIIIPTAPAQIVENHTGKIIFVGLVDPSDDLIAIIVVGITCKEEVFNRFLYFFLFFNL